MRMIVADALENTLFLAFQETEDGVALFEGTIMPVADFQKLRIAADAAAGIEDPENHVFFWLTPESKPTTLTSFDSVNQRQGDSLAILMAVSTASFILIAATAIIITLKRRRRLSANSKFNISSSWSPESAKNIQATLDMTRTQAPNSNSVALAIPGYMKRTAKDFVIFEDEELGRGASAVIYRSAVTFQLERELGYKEIAVKVFKVGGNQLRDVKFELALLSALQKKSKHILELDFADIAKAL